MWTDATYADQNTQMILVVYSHLEVATIEETAHHLIKQHDGSNNIYWAWKALCEWYDGFDVKNKEAGYFRSKLEIYGIK